MAIAVVGISQAQLRGTGDAFSAFNLDALIVKPQPLNVLKRVGLRAIADKGFVALLFDAPVLGQPREVGGVFSISAINAVVA